MIFNVAIRALNGLQIKGFNHMIANNLGFGSTGDSSADAAFLPAAETAVSLVHDAHPRLGETVAVFGQGVIGLLVTAACAAMGLRVHAVDLESSGSLPVLARHRVAEPD